MFFDLAFNSLAFVAMTVGELSEQLKNIPCDKKITIIAFGTKHVFEIDGIIDCKNDKGIIVKIREVKENKKSETKSAEGRKKK